MISPRPLSKALLVAGVTQCCLVGISYANVSIPASTMADFFGLEFERAIVAGAPTGGVPGNDSTSARINPNTNIQPFGGVVSLNLNGGGLCTGTLIAADIVLTAGHCVDITGGIGAGDGVVDLTPAQITVNFNSGSTLSATRGVSAINLNPNYTGFANPVINDDLAILQLSSDAPSGVPIYGLAPAGSLSTSFAHAIIMVGYGNTGLGTSGYTGGASFTTKRVGGNLIEAYQTDAGDEGNPAKVEVFFHDFESTASGPIFTYEGLPIYNASAGNAIGGNAFTLGNLLEANVGGGDSGGPAFSWDSVNNIYRLAGVNTATSRGLSPSNNGTFGTIGAGIWLETYLPWIESFLPQQGEPVPEPSTYLGGVGVVLAGVWAWHRKRKSPATT